MNRDLQEYNEWSAKQNSALTNLKRNLGPFQIIGLVITFILAFRFLQDSGLDSFFVWFGLIALVFGVLWFFNKGSRSMNPIPENVAKAITLAVMKRKVSKEYPSGTHVITLPFCALRFTGAWGISWTPWRWEIGIRVFTPNGLKRDVLVCLHPYEGYVTRIMDMPSGYTGLESPDIKTLTPEVYEPIENKEAGP